MLGRVLVQPACRRVVGDARGNMARSYDRRAPEKRKLRHGCQPRVRRTMSVEHVNIAALVEPTPERAERRQILARNRQRDCGYPKLPRAILDRSLRLADDRHAVAAALHTEGLGQNADLLSSPAAG